MDKFEKINLFIEINNENFIFAAGVYDEELNFKILEKEIAPLIGIIDGKIIDLEVCADILKKTVSIIEKKLNYVFENANVIIDHHDFDCINITGFKKLHGNQILSEDISFILNNLKTKLNETEKNKTVIHLFNTKFSLDNNLHKNLPIGLFGDFYSHQLTFFLIKKNEIKNLISLLSKCNLNLNKVILKSFVEGIDLIYSEKKETFFKIIIYKDKIKLIYFYNSAFCFYQNFNFGSDIILKDIAKVCSLKFSNIQKLISNKDFDISKNSDQIIDKDFFKNENPKKISLKHVNDISAARIDEIVKIIFKNNKSLDIYKLEDYSLSLYFEDKNILKKFKKDFQDNFDNQNIFFEILPENNILNFINIFGDLLSKGWVKEAIPVINKKKSWITRLFSKIFE